MEKKPVVIIADPESLDFYRTLPLWGEQTEFYPVSNAAPDDMMFNADLVLIDCGCDDMTGLGLISEIKRKNPSIPVLFLTEAGSEETAIKAFRLGARDYIKKPIGILELRDAVTKFLDLKRAANWGKSRRYIGDMFDNVMKQPRSTQSDLSPNLLRVIRFVNDNLSGEISIDQMAKEAGFSKCHFCREFKKETGLTPMSFLYRLRIKRSKEFLGKNLPVSIVAMKVGFNDLSTFNRHFKKITGLTPTEFRNSQQK